VTVTVTAGRAVPSSTRFWACMVNANSTSTITVGISVQVSSSRLLPWVWVGSSSPRRRYRTIDQTTSPDTTRNTTAAMYRNRL
jgi:hypothetical protein